MRERVPGWGRAGLTGAAVLTVPLWLRDPYYVHLAVTIAMFSIAALGARLLLLLRLWSFGQGVFLTIGAYTSAVLVAEVGLSFWAALPITALGGAVAAAAVGYPALRLRGVYFAIFTMVLVFAVREAIILAPEQTGGASGFVGVPRPGPIAIGGFEIAFGTRARLYTIVAVLLLLTMAVMHRIDRSRLATVLSAVRQDEVLAESVGINLTRYRVGAFVIAAFFTTAAGAFSAHYYAVAHPAIWGLWPSIFIVTYAIIGGTGSVFGPVVGATAGVLVVEFLRPTQGLQGILLGTALIIVGSTMIGGLTGALSTRTFDRIMDRLPKRRPRDRSASARRSAHQTATDPIGGQDRRQPERDVG